MSAWEEFSGAYVEAAASSLPLHRAAVAVLASISSLAVTHQTHKSILESILRIELAHLTAIDSPLLKNSNVGTVAAGLAAAIAGLFLSPLLLRIVFALATRSTSIFQRAKESSLASAGIHLDFEKRKAAADLLSSSLEQPRRRLRAYNSTVEVLTATSVLFLVLAYWGNILDVLTAIAAGLFALLLTVRSTLFFLSDYFGPAMVKAELEGRRPPSAEDLR
jgi:hypothetical protein